MKSVFSAVVIAAVLATPVAAFAQSDSNQPMTRAQVRAQLDQLEQAGYKPSGDKVTYPAAIQAAQARVSGQNASAQANISGYGAPGAGSVDFGAARPVQTSGPGTVYFGH
ncbi:DUF4148 domain-containing protein [Paraburkholderia sp.]|jgi:Ni/Co efflux regulator RcnB|uniref:DUF4148 domain-containing protein n=1 Tax=Paraburkholderia sp. TaxID=1926495 RepID=UPI002F420A99